MIKASYPKTFVMGTFIIDDAVLIDKEKVLKDIYKSVDKVVQVWEGEPDLVLARRLLGLLGGGRIVVKDLEQSDPEIVY